MHLFAQARGRTIQGRAYFRGGAPARNATVALRAPDGRTLAETTTDDAGEFAVEARWRCDHQIMVTTGDGHGADFTVKAAELPEELPPLPREGDEPSLPASTPAPNTAAAAIREDAATLPRDADPTAKLDDIDRQIAALRRQLEAYEQTTRLRDVLGGLGYILGIAGVAYYVLARRRIMTTETIAADERGYGPAGKKSEPRMNADERR